MKPVGRSTESKLRDAIVGTYAALARLGMNEGSSGNVSVRHGAGIVTVALEPARLDGTTGGIGTPDAIAFSVHDQGEGIPPEMAPRVFRQFWRGKRRGGTGLGLYIVKGLVEAQGGTIGVRNAPDGGAEFRLTVPAGTPPG